MDQPDWNGPLARYFVKFIQAYQAQGIPINDGYRSRTFKVRWDGSQSFIYTLPAGAEECPALIRDEHYFSI